MKYHENLKRVAVRAMHSLFADRTVSPEQTIDTMEDLIDELEIMVEALKAQVEDQS